MAPSRAFTQPSIYYEGRFGLSTTWMNEPNAWRVIPTRQWPPKGRPLPPVSPSLAAVFKACPLQAVFASSGEYPRRVTPYMLIGRAYHRTLEAIPSLVENVRWDPAEAAKLALMKFREVLQEERNQNSSERGSAIPWPDERVSRAEIALILEVRQYASQGATLQEVILERRMESHDGLLVGIADRVERHAHGVRIVDIKTGSMQSADEGFRHQVLAYAYLWHETTGEWPVDALIEHPLEGVKTRVEVSPSECVAVGDEMRVLARQLVEGLADPKYLARPGAPCVGCDFQTRYKA